MTGYEPRYLEDGLLLSSSGPWAWFRLPTRSALTEGQLVSLLHQEDRLLSGLRDAEGHLLVVSRSHPASRWALELDGRAPAQMPGWLPHLEQVVEHLRGQRFRQREVYLGLRLARGRRRSWLHSLLTGPERLMGLESPRPEGRLLAGLRGELDLTLRAVTAASPGARLAGAAELRWLIRRAFWRGLLEDAEVSEPPARPAWGGEMLALLEGLIRNGYRQLRLGDEATGIGHVATLGMAHMPEALPFPGGEWLYHYERRLDFPVEASVRFRVVSPRESAGDLRGQRAKAEDQLRHVLDTAHEPPLDVWETYDGALHLEHRVVRGQQPLVYCWPRLLVAASSEQELVARITDLVESYQDLGIALVRPTGDQLALFLEALPGDRLRIGAYEQRMDPVTLAGSMYTLSPEVGDGRGPYFGYTVGASPSPVTLDVFAAADRDRPTGIVLVGEPGGGKTNTALKLVHDARLRGAWIVAFARKEEDVWGLARLPEMAEVHLVRPDPSYEGLLDPFRIEADPEAGSLLAADLCRTFLPIWLGREAEGHLLTAAEAESAVSLDGYQPSLRGVVERLAGSEHQLAREAAEALRAIAGKPMSRLCFGTGQGRRLRPEGGLTIVLLEELGLPEVATRAEEWDISERLAVGLLRAMTALVAGRFLRPEQRHQPKLLYLDEAWAVLGSAHGRRLVERIARIGRARNLALLLATQNASDLYAGDPANTAVTNSLSVRLGFRSTDENEIRAMLALLGVEATPDLMAAVSGFGAGECLMRDLDGRVGRVQVDLVTEELRQAFDTTPKAQAAIGGGSGDAA